MPARPKVCPCHSGLRYAECCGPRHDGSRPAETPEALMRSRYSAFALGLGTYLITTLAEAHEDRAHDPAHLARELGRVRERQRFLGLRIVHAEAHGDRGRVLFHARIFERGRDVSFAELSEFVREEGAWRYLRGELRSVEALGCRPEALTLSVFERA